MARSNKNNQYKEPWERLPDETAKAFEAFAVYRDLGPSRGIREVARRLDKSRTLIGEWSSKYGWVERALSWDAEQDRLNRLEQLEEIKKMKKRHADLATDMLAKAAKGLKNLSLKEMTAANITMMIDIAAKLERVSRGEPDSITEERRRVEDIAANKAIETLATDPGFLAAVQSAFSQAEGSSTSSSTTGSMDSNEDRGPAVE
ncbi:hypothetical protein [Petroclostridium sp. X23]|uniref:hypothetical protein n=1 Tax=Petroclostridium sp. X23 TaxID=3045146 RepID=UPI0024AD1041|nr:hypothetical protein [Petroclostridium sp. X23]WHH58296.1 hypothetical protein QKW49_21230 [Petroclostridium sp. X23]